MTFEEIAETIESGSVVIGGMQVKVVALTDACMQAIVDSFPHPKEPLIKDPNKGSLAPKIVDESDVDYKINRRAWSLNTRAAQAVLGMKAGGVNVPELAGPEGAYAEGTAQWRAGLVAATTRLRSKLPGEIIERIVKTMDGLVSKAIAEAQKN